MQTELLDPELTPLEYMMKEFKDLSLQKMRSVVRAFDVIVGGGG